MLIKSSDSPPLDEPELELLELDELEDELELELEDELELELEELLVLEVLLDEPPPPHAVSPNKATLIDR